MDFPTTRTFSTTILTILTLPNFIRAVPIDNGVVQGRPEIECAAKSILINFNTQNNFEGHVYVKGRYEEPGCRTDATGRSTASIELPFSDCGVSRQRTTEPSMITTALRTQNIPMPVCRYEIRDGTAEGEIVEYAIIGQKVYHKWTCDSETFDTFCMRVYGCYVDDGRGDRMDLLDEQGCAIDKYLLNNLDYLSNLMAGQEVHVFKYADRPQLYFQCQIEILVKEPEVDCVRPTCAPLRARRQALGVYKSNLTQSWDAQAWRERNSLQQAAVVDVRAQEIAALEAGLNGNDDLRQYWATARNAVAESRNERQSGICVTNSGITVALLSLLAVVLCTIFTATLIAWRRSNNFYTKS